MKSLMSSKPSQTGSLIFELCPLIAKKKKKKKSLFDCVISITCLHLIFLKLADNEDINETLDEFENWLNWIILRVTSL